MDLGLKDQVAIVTGGSRGIGRATAKALLREGAKVVIASVRSAHHCARSGPRTPHKLSIHLNARSSA